MTKLKPKKSIDATVEVLMKGIKHLEVIVEKLSDKVAALEAKDIQMKEHIDKLLNLKSNKKEKATDRQEANFVENIESSENLSNMTKLRLISSSVINVNILVEEIPK